MRIRSIIQGLVVGMCVALFSASAQGGVQLQSTEFQVTSDANGHSTPVIGHDAISDYIVYTEYPIVNGVAGNSNIYYQRVANGQPTGSPVVVADSSENQYLNDASGDYIVYTRAPAVGMVGNIVLFQISTGLSRPLTSTSDCVSPKIFGNLVIWIEELATGAQILMYDVTTGVPVQTTVMAGPTPPIGDAAIGDRFIVWSQLVNGQYDVAAYDMQKGLSESVAASPLLNEQRVATEGPWITFETSSVSKPTSISIQAINMDTGVTLTVADNGGYNQKPNISGDLLAYESNILGYFQVFVFRLAEGDTFQATSSTNDERLNYLRGSLVTYVDDRTVNYNIYASSLTFVTTTPPLLPIANAGTYPTAHAGQVVHLDGSGSTDPSLQNLTLSYQWSLGVPSGSSSTLSAFNVVNPTFTPDEPGTYVATLVVSDALGSSTPSQASISTLNTPPVAVPGSAQVIVQVGSTVQLDGSASYDADGDQITYLWSFVNPLPSGSKAALSGSTTAKPTFVADVFGTYTVQLIVADQWDQSAPATVSVSFKSVKPVADAGASQTAVVGQTVVLDGTGSSDANLLPLSYQWSFTSIPPRSIAVIGNPTAARPTFVPDVPGKYIAQLIVTDVALSSDPATVQVKAVSDITFVHSNLVDAVALIGSLERSAFRSPGLRNELIRGIHDIMDDFEDHHYCEAAHDVDAITRRVDGCAQSTAPDRDDWILVCPAQIQVYQDLQNAKSGIQPLITGNCR